MKYYEISPESKEYILADKIYLSQHEWSKKEVIEDLEIALKITPIGNIECNPHVLRLDEMPEGTQVQFKKNIIQGKHEAYAKSEINKKYLEVIKKYNLKTYGVIEFVLDVGLFGFLKSLCPIKMKDSLRYFVELKDNLSEKDIEKVKAKEYLIEIKESEYLQLMANMVKSIEDAQVHPIPE